MLLPLAVVATAAAVCGGEVEIGGRTACFLEASLESTGDSAPLIKDINLEYSAGIMSGFTFLRV